MKPSQNTPKAPAPAVEIDDREPMDRLADELGRFVQAMQKMNARQQAQAMEILAELRSRAERGPAPPAPVTVDLSAGRPSRYRVTVTGRDKSGRIATVDIEAAGGVADVVGRAKGMLQ